MKRILFYIAFILFLFSGCSTNSLISDDKAESFGVRSYEESNENINPSILIVGDTQPGKRIIEKFYRKENWKTWKQAIFPFYQIYLFGNGFIGSINHLRNWPDYGRNSRELMRDVLFRQSKHKDYDFLMILGDIVGVDGRVASHWDIFLEDYSRENSLFSSLPIAPVIGNHEHANNVEYGFENYSRIFKQDRFYTLNFKDIDIFVLDTNIILDRYQDIPDNKQEELFVKWFVDINNHSSWLEQQLSSSDAKYKVVVTHHSPMMLGHHFKDWYIKDNGPDVSSKRDAFVKLMQKYHVDLVLSGHEHNYQHILLENKESPIHFVITSSGGVPVRSLPEEKEIARKIKKLENFGYSVRPVLLRSDYHFSELLIDASGQLTLNTFLVDKDLRQKSSLLDRIVVSH